MIGSDKTIHRLAVGHMMGGVALWDLAPDDAQGASPGNFIQILCDAHSQMVIHSGWLPDEVFIEPPGNQLEFGLGLRT